MKVLLLINPENVSDEEVKKYKVRHAARAVVVDANGNIALLYVAKENYYKLPGGGLEEHEDHITALQRECREEIGVDIEVIGKIGTIVEYRKFDGLNQISDCYFAKARGQKSASTFTDEEKENNFRVEWLSYQEAVRAILEHVSTWIEGNAYVIPRDSMFLKEAKRFIF